MSKVKVTIEIDGEVHKVESDSLEFRYGYKVMDSGKLEALVLRQARKQ